MKIRARLTDIKINDKLKPELTFAAEKISEQIENLKGKVIDMNLKEYRADRTIEANDLYWGMLRQLNYILGIGLENLHKQMLKEYGLGTYVKVKNEAMDTFKRTIKYYYELNKDEEHTELLILKNSSDMNTKEFWTLTQGVIQECRDQGIPVPSDDEVHDIVANRRKR